MQFAQALADFTRAFRAACGVPSPEPLAGVTTTELRLSVTAIITRLNIDSGAVVPEHAPSTVSIKELTMPFERCEPLIYYLAMTMKGKRLELPVEPDLN